MPAILTGFTPNKLILNSTNFRREIVGLERINDVYTARTEDAAGFAEIIRNGTPHSTVMGYLTPAPATSERFPNMLVESVESANEVGSITRFNVTYVGLLRDLRPKPVISLQPAERYAFNPFVVTVEFVESIGDVGSQEEITFLKKYARLQPFPARINGYLMPQSSVAPFQGQVTSRLIQIIGSSQFFEPAIGAFSSEQVLRENFQREIVSRQLPQAKQIELNYDVPTPKVEFYGLLISGVSYQRYGKFAHAIVSASDSARYTYWFQAEDAVRAVSDSINLI